MMFSLSRQKIILFIVSVLLVVLGTAYLLVSRPAEIKRMGGGVPTQAPFKPEVGEKMIDDDDQLPSVQRGKEMIENDEP